MSPVIGVILMVAITVVLAAVVFRPRVEPRRGFGVRSERLVQQELERPDPDGGHRGIRNWDDFSLALSGAADEPNCNYHLETADGDVTSATLGDTSADHPVEAGDVLVLDEASAGDCDGVTVRLTHDGTNSLVYDTTF